MLPIFKLESYHLPCQTTCCGACTLTSILNVGPEGFAAKDDTLSAMFWTQYGEVRGSQLTLLMSGAGGLCVAKWP